MKNLLVFFINIAVDKIILWPFYYPIVYLMKEVKVDNISKSNGITLQWSDKLGHKDSLIIQTIRRSINDTSKNQEATRNVYG